MLFVIDAGNTNIVGAVYEDSHIIDSFRLATAQEKTEDEYGVIVKAILLDHGIDVHKITRVIISSVVPQLTAAMMRMSSQLFKAECKLLGPNLYEKLPLQIVNPKEIGTDLVANSMAAWSRHKGSSIVVDFGTALTFTSINEKGAIVGVAIAPGLGTAAASLAKSTAQLPIVHLEAPVTAMGRNTIEAIQAGVVLGYIGLVEYMLNRIKTELGGAYVIATGGLSRIISDKTNAFDEIDPVLTLGGLASMEKYFFE